MIKVDLEYYFGLFGFEFDDDQWEELINEWLESMTNEDETEEERKQHLRSLERAYMYCVFQPEDVLNYQDFKDFLHDKFEDEARRTKMSRELEALENIKKLFIGSPIDLSQQFGIIENALKEKEEWDELENMFPHGKTSIRSLMIILTQLDIKDSDTLLNKLKALEIIKRKPFILPTVLMFETYEEYFEEYGEWNEEKDDTCYTKEEFDLLREVLNGDY